MNSAQFIRWSRLHEKRTRGGSLREWIATVVAAGAFAALVYWRLHEVSPASASKTWLAGALAAFAVAFLRVPFHLYWRPDAALLAQLPIGGGPLFDAALLRCVRAAVATALVVVAGAAPLAQLDDELFARHAAVAGVMFALAAGFMPAVATWAASLVTSTRDVLELATALGGAPVQRDQRDKAASTASAPGSSSAVLGAVPGFAATVVIVFVIIISPWLTARETALPAVPVMLVLVGVSVVTIVAMRAAAPRRMGTILRDVSALDRQRLATLEIRPPTAIEALVARVVGERDGAALVYRKDARLMRRRYPMAFALGALAFLVLVIVGLAQPSDPVPWLVGVLAATTMYAVALAGRLRRPPIEIPRLVATLPMSPAAISRAKLAWVVAWALVFVAVPVGFAAIRLL